MAESWNRRAARNGSFPWQWSCDITVIVGSGDSYPAHAKVIQGANINVSAGGSSKIVIETESSSMGQSSVIFSELTLVKVGSGTTVLLSCLTQTRLPELVVCGGFRAITCYGNQCDWSWQPGCRFVQTGCFVWFLYTVDCYSSSNLYHG
jgi:hypothetical protein